MALGKDETSRQHTTSESNEPTAGGGVAPPGRTVQKGRILEDGMGCGKAVSNRAAGITTFILRKSWGKSEKCVLGGCDRALIRDKIGAWKNIRRGEAGSGCESREKEEQRSLTNKKSADQREIEKNPVRIFRKEAAVHTETCGL